MEIEKFEDTPFEKNHQISIEDTFYYKVYEDKDPCLVIYYLYLKKTIQNL